MNTQTQNQKQSYTGGSLKRIEAQWVADWLRSQGVELPNGWTSIWKMNAKQVSIKYNKSMEDVIAAANGEKR